MPTIKRLLIGTCVVAACAVTLAGCDILGLFFGGQEVDNYAAGKISEGRMNAARALVPTSTMYVDLLQRNLQATRQDPCLPMGDVTGNIAPWPSRLGGPVQLSLSSLQPPIPNSEYDVLLSKGQTDFIISMRIPVEPTFPLEWTSIDFNFRSVNPFVAGHTPGGHYFVDDANFPSNDDNTTVVTGFPDNRTVIKLDGGDVAIVVRGIQFTNGANLKSTAAMMNNLGSTAWVAFMRDNAIKSGRFFALVGALTGGPVAFFDTPGTADDGQFNSVPVNGDTFDLYSEDPRNLAGPPVFDFCDASPIKQYAFMDWSNVDNLGNVAPGRGGFIFVMRPEAFQVSGGPVKIVLDPADNPLNPPTAANTIAPLPSGYDEKTIPEFTGSHAAQGAPGAPGVHELSISVGFLHTQKSVTTPAIDIEKLTNGQNADLPTGPVIPVGDPILWTYVVTNTGAADLSSVAVTDDQGVVVSCPKSTLVIGESMVCTATGTAVAGQYANIATVTGTDSGGTVVTDQDPSHYFGEIQQQCAVRGNDQLKISDDKVEWKLYNTDTQKLTLDEITITWPAGLGNLKKIKLGGSEIYDQALAPPSATINAGWKGATKDRQIDAGKSETLTFEFQNKLATAQGDYAIRVDFAEGCWVVFTPGVFFNCEKPIQALTMIWNGTQAIKIKAWKGAVGSTLLAEIDNIQVGDEVTVGGYSGSPNDVIWEVFHAGTTTKIGQSKFHVSCSDDDMDGSEDCGKAEGDGKANEAGLINDWLLEGIVGATSTLDCTP